MSLASRLTSDLDKFLNTSQFAKTAVIGSGTRNQVSINGIFENEYIESVDVNSLTPTFLCKTSDLTNIKVGNNLTVDNTDYKIRDPQQDGTGLTLLVLEKQ